MGVNADMTVGFVHSGANGVVEVLEYANAKDVVIRFVETGNVITSQAGHIRDGTVKDVMRPSIYGVGFVGSGKYKATESGKCTKQYSTWLSMLTRCYCPKFKAKFKTYDGCSVASEWHNFQVYSEWFDDNYVEGHHLDKDIKIDGNKVYSPDACLFVSPAENTIKASAKSYTFISPDKEIVHIYNMNQFCRDNNLHDSLMVKVNNGIRSHHKGWTKA